MKNWIFLDTIGLYYPIPSGSTDFQAEELLLDWFSQFAPQFHENTKMKEGLRWSFQRGEGYKDFESKHICVEFKKNAAIYFFDSLFLAPKNARDFLLNHLKIRCYRLDSKCFLSGPTKTSLGSGPTSCPTGPMVMLGSAPHPLLDPLLV